MKTTPIFLLVIKNPMILSIIIRFLGSSSFPILLQVCKLWRECCLFPSLWEYLAASPISTLLTTCFRRALLPSLREKNEAIPNVNRKTYSLSIKCGIQSEDMENSQFEYKRKLWKIMNETLILNNNVPRGLFLYEKGSQWTHNPFNMDFTTRLGTMYYGSSNGNQVISGKINDEKKAEFYLYQFTDPNENLNESEPFVQTTIGRIEQSNALCYDIGTHDLAIGLDDGSIKYWNLRSFFYASSLSPYTQPLLPTLSLQQHSSYFSFLLRRRTMPSITQIAIERDITSKDSSSPPFFYNEYTTSTIATANEHSMIQIWNLARNTVILTLSALTHPSFLTSAVQDYQCKKNNVEISPTLPTITSLYLLHHRLIYSTSTGLLRIYDIRTKQCTHRLLGHPKGLTCLDISNGYLWTGGKDGILKYWGSKAGKVCSSSALAHGQITVLRSNDTLLVVGYENGSIAAYDLRTRNLLLTFSNRHYASSAIHALEFDSLKIISITNDGKAYLWRWYNTIKPEYQFLSYYQNEKVYYTSISLSADSLLLGTTSKHCFYYDLRTLF